MANYFSVGETAKKVQTTIETLRYYDRIGLVQPSKKDAATNYRYYTDQDIVRINTVLALKQMDLPLRKIKEVLGFNDLEKLIAFLNAAEKKADQKMVALKDSKEKIERAKQDYEKRLRAHSSVAGISSKFFEQRVILLSNTLSAPTVDNLWHYLDNFYGQLSPQQVQQFSFADTAGIYIENNIANMFAICLNYVTVPGLKILPAGNYLCADCTEENRSSKLDELTRIAQSKYGIKPQFTVQQIMISGILQWHYQLQVYLGKSENSLD
ncbi:MerR family transcriptional regulator [Lapidilactobacillus wuchangensis]|uniref:MerR family transcriptional regulator n=1 Tax=Lapidilactobacillus wuchangensis TaxID=2486001 RepID=UPI000F7890D7|nr:MerR family transcriptional regulator [Lapidilactobacillus wuchangensis]